MIGYWKMEADAANQSFAGYLDETTNANHGLCAASCPTVTSSGIVENGQVFNGFNTGIDIGANTIYDFHVSDGFTIELWFKRQSVTGREVLIGRDSNTSNRNWWLGLQPSGRIAFSATSTDGVSALVESRPQKVIVNDLWHHVAIVGHDNNIQLYVDGNLEDSVTILFENVFESSESINIGYLNDGAPGFHYGGIIDEIAFYDLPLSENDIQMHYYLSRDYCTANDTPVRIMPMGDSITFDSRSGENRPISDRTGYRWTLWNWLNHTDYSVDFVGSEASGSDIFEDPDNAGFPGINATELLEIVRTGYDPHDAKNITPGPYLHYYPSDIILLHIGTNDVKIDVSDIENMLGEIDSYNPNLTVILARIINRVGGSSITSQFNENLESMAQSRILNGDKIIVVDMEFNSGIVYQLEPDGDMYDSLHPTNASNPDIIDSGYAKMARVWFNALKNILPRPHPDCSGDMASLWALDEISGDFFVDALYGNHGMGSLSPVSVTGKIAGAQNFNGIDMGINVPPDDSFNWTDDASFSIAYWIKRKDSAFHRNEVVLGRDDGSVSKMHWWTGLRTDGKATFVLIATNGKGSGSRETGEYLEGNDDLTDGIWHHITVARDSASTENRLYVDGELNDSVSIAYDIGAGFESESAHLNMGWLNLGPGYHFSGTIDEVAIYSRVLTTDEILKHFNSGLSYCSSANPPNYDNGDDGTNGDSNCFIDTLR